MHPEAIKKISAELRDKIAAALAQSSLQATVAATRAASAEDTGTFEVVISTNDVDRSGEIVDQNGWDLTHYKNNPVVLWGHDYYSLPIGVCDELTVRTVGTKQELVAKGRFAPEAANPFAQQVRRLYDAGMMRTTSVGFIAHEMEGNTITKAELLEFSFVPVPANPMALSARQMKELGIDREIFATKGLSIKEEAETPAAPAEETPAETPATETPAETPAPAEVPAPEAPAAEETPAPEAPAAETPAEKSKGALGDEVAAQDAYEQKWEKLDALCELIDAFFNVYLDEATSPDQFDALLKEFITLCEGLVGSTEPAEPSEASALIDRLKAARANGKSIITRDAVEVILSSHSNDGGGAVIKRDAVEPEQTPSGEAAKERSIHAGSEAAIRALKAWNADRAALREIATLVGTALEASAKRYTAARKTK